MTVQQQGRDKEEVLAEDITNHPDSEGEEEDTKTIEVGPSIVRKKKKV
jgi:hypothetical protein